MKNGKIILLASFILFFSSLAAHAQAPIWTDLGDIARYRPDIMPDAAIILSSLRTKNALYAPNRENFVGNIQLQEYPVAGQADAVNYKNVTAIMQDTEGNLFFRRFSLSVAGNPRAVQSVSILEDIALSDTHFAVNTGLIQRMVLLHDDEHKIFLLYPLGVGSIDAGVMHPGRVSLLTPLYQNAVLKRGTVQSHRTDPSYYRNEAFMPITNARGILTPIAFHISILSDDDWANKGGNYLVRGFDSHGCMRLRQKDLREFYKIVMNGASEELPVNVSYFVTFENSANGPIIFGSESDTSAEKSLTEVHPYPLNLAYYQRVQNVAGPGEPPRPGRDPVEGLVLLEKVYSNAPPLSRLVGIDGDDMTDLNDFLGLTEDQPLHH